MGIPLKHRTIHECTRVAFVGVTADILLVIDFLGGKLPFKTGGETRTAAAAQARLLNLVNNLLGGHLGNSLSQCGITVTGNILINILGVDDTAVTQCHTLLTREKSYVFKALCYVLGVLITQKQALYNSSLDQMLVNDFFHIIGRYMAICSSLGIDNHNGSFFAKTEATGFNNLDFLFDTVGG